MKLPQKAETEFKAALAIDPSYGDAYFNLAVLYATWEPPKWDEARRNYQEALKKGIKANPDLERLLKEAPPAPVIQKESAVSVN
jgi:Tfp pilus assembly protein PilF